MGCSCSTEKSADTVAPNVAANVAAPSTIGGVDPHEVDPYPAAPVGESLARIQIVQKGDPRLNLDIVGLNAYDAMQATMKEMGYVDEDEMEVEAVKENEDTSNGGSILSARKSAAPSSFVRKGDPRLNLDIVGLNAYDAMQATMKEMGYDSDGDEVDAEKEKEKEPPPKASARKSKRDPEKGERASKVRSHRFDHGDAAASETMEQPERDRPGRQVFRSHRISDYPDPSTGTKEKPGRERPPRNEVAQQKPGGGAAHGGAGGSAGINADVPAWVLAARRRSEAVMAKEKADREAAERDAVKPAADAADAAAAAGTCAGSVAVAGTSAGLTSAMEGVAVSASEEKWKPQVGDIILATVKGAELTVTVLKRDHQRVRVKIDEKTTAWIELRHVKGLAGVGTAPVEGVAEGVAEGVVESSARAMAKKETNVVAQRATARALARAPAVQAAVDRASAPQKPSGTVAAEAAIGAVAAEELPIGWEAKEDTKGRVYYVNKSIGRTQWSRPDEARQSLSGTSLPPGWAEKLDPKGRVYYAHTLTGASQWTVPVPSERTNLFSC